MPQTKPSSPLAVFKVIDGNADALFLSDSDSRDDLFYAASGVIPVGGYITYAEAARLRRWLNKHIKGFGATASYEK